MRPPVFLLQKKARVRKEKLPCRMLFHNGGARFWEKGRDAGEKEETGLPDTWLVGLFNCRCSAFGRLAFLYMGKNPGFHQNKSGKRAGIIPECARHGRNLFLLPGKGGGNPGQFKQARHGHGKPDRGIHDGCEAVWRHSL